MILMTMSIVMNTDDIYHLLIQYIACAILTDYIILQKQKTSKSCTKISTLTEVHSKTVIRCGHLVTSIYVLLRVYNCNKLLVLCILLP